MNTPTPPSEQAPYIDDRHLLAIAIGLPDPERWLLPPADPLAQASALLQACGSLNAIARTGPARLKEAGGLDDLQLDRLLVAMELGKRQSAPNLAAKPPLNTAAEAARIIEPLFANLTQETFQTILLNSRRQVISIHQIYQGNVNRTIVRAAEVYRPAVLENAPYVILAHNHPSGDPTPSVSDIKTTAELYQAGITLNISLIDHLVVNGSGAWVSMRDRGLGFPAPANQLAIEKSQADS